MKCRQIDTRRGFSGLRQNRQVRFQREDGTVFAISLLHGGSNPAPTIKLSGPVNCEMDNGSTEFFGALIQLATKDEGGLDAVVRSILEHGGTLV